MQYVQISACLECGLSLKKAFVATIRQEVNVGGLGAGAYYEICVANVAVAREVKRE